MLFVGSDKLAKNGFLALGSKTLCQVSTTLKCFGHFVLFDVSMDNPHLIFILGKTGTCTAPISRGKRFIHYLLNLN